MDYSDEISKKDLNQFIEKFESCELKKEEWRHSDHVVMAFFYLTNHKESEATEKIVRGIKNLNEKHGIVQAENQGYHHTWTIFFIKILLKRIKTYEFQKLTLTQKVHDLIFYLKNFKDISREYYSSDLIMSKEARENWMEPDLRPRDF